MVKVRINRMVYRDDTNTKAYASAAIDEKFAVHNIKVVGGPKGNFVSMPQTKINGKYQDIFHPISAESREELYGAVMQAYEQKVREVQEQAAAGHTAGYDDFGWPENGASSGDDSSEGEEESETQSEAADMTLSM
jgi:stage V sporulation protein G